MFINNEKSAIIHADLNCKLIDSSLPIPEQAKLLLQIIKDTKEYKEISTGILSDALDDDIFNRIAGKLCNQIIRILDSYSPEGYYFGKSYKEQNNYGFWHKPGTLLWAEKIIEYDRDPDYAELQAYLNNRKDVIHYFRSEREILCDFSERYHNKVENVERKIYVFKVGSVSDRHDAWNVVHCDEQNGRLSELIDLELVQFYTPDEFCEACNNQDYDDMGSYWLVYK